MEQPAPAAPTGTSNAQPLWHFCVLCLASFGLYEFYWFYKTWKFLKEREKLDVSPIWRSVFAPFFAYSLFNRICDVAFERGCTVPRFSLILAGIYLALCLFCRLPDPASAGALLAFLPLVPVVKVLNDFWRLEQPGLPARTRLSRGEIAVLVIGGAPAALILLDTFLPG